MRATLSLSGSRPSPYCASARQHTWDSRALPEAPRWYELHRGPEPQMETRDRVRTAECLCFSKATAAAAQRQECIASSAILSEEKGTERGGLWDAGGLSAAVAFIASPLPPLAFNTGNSLCLKMPVLRYSFFSFLLRLRLSLAWLRTSGYHCLSLFSKRCQIKYRIAHLNVISDDKLLV